MLLLCPLRPAGGYVEVAYSLGRLVNESTNVLLMQVEKLDKQKNLIIYRKVQDIKGVHKGEVIKHDIGQRGFNPREWKTIMAWAEVGKTALFFHNGGAGEVCLKDYWYQCYGGDWWRMSHGEPYLLRSFAGRPRKLAVAVAAMLAGAEVTVSCMVDGDKKALQLRTARVQRMRASLKLIDYNPKRDFVGWGVEEFRRIRGMPGFSHYGPLTQVSPGAAGVAPTDLDGDGRGDLMLFGASRAVLLHNSDGALNEVSLPSLRCGARAAAWEDFNADGNSDLLLATPLGPRLFRNAAEKMTDVTAGLPAQGYYNLTAAAWLDYDGDKRPDVLLADGFRGLRLYRNLGVRAGPPEAAELGTWQAAGPFDNTGGRGFYSVYPPEEAVDLTAEYVGKAGAKVTWKEVKLADGRTHRTRLYRKNEHRNDVTTYLYRQIDLGGAADVPVVMAWDGTLRMWLNGRLILSEPNRLDVHRRESKRTVRLGLKHGKNHLLLKISRRGGQFGLHFEPKWPVEVVPPLFADVSEKVGLGEGGLGGKAKGDHLAVADVNGDGRPDVLYGAAAPGKTVLAINTPRGFVEAAGCGIEYQAGGVRPAFGDYNGDGHVDLFVPQDGRCRLFRNDGRGRFVDVSAAAGALAAPIARATCAAWADFDARRRLDLMVGCLGGPNRFFRNNGDGTFAEATESIGLDRQIFNTRGLSITDLNGDGVLDVIFSNEGQESSVLLGKVGRRALAAGE